MTGIVRAPRPTRGYTEIANSTARDERLSYRARGILLRLLSNQDGYRMTSEDLAHAGREGRGAVLAALRELKVAGYLVISKRQDGRGRWSTHAIVYDTPQVSRAVSTEVGFSDSGSPDAGSSASIQNDEQNAQQKIKHTPPRGKGKGGMRGEMRNYLDWFERHGVTMWNLSARTAEAGGRRVMKGDSKCGRQRAELEKTAEWAYHRNEDGADIYLRPATGPDWPAIFLDDIPLAKGLAFARKNAAMVIETSKDNCQIWIATNKPLTISERGVVQRALAAWAGGDMASISGDHFGRAPGYKNHKPGRNAFVVRVLASSDLPPLDPTPYLPLSPSPAGAGRGASRPARAAGLGAGRDHTESGREFRWVCDRLRLAGKAGRDLAAECDFLITELAERALQRGKRGDAEGAHEYAKRTVVAAQKAVAA